MGIVGGFDVHRAQITFEYLDTELGEVRRGRIRPVTRDELRAWLTPFWGVPDVSFALEATTGWRFIVEELARVGIAAHLAEPADTRALRGPKRRAKTDRADAHHLRTLLQDGRLPESWIPPPYISELRTTVRFRQALLFQHGQPGVRHLLTREHRGWLERVELSPAGPARSKGASSERSSSSCVGADRAGPAIQFASATDPICCGAAGSPGTSPGCQ